MVDQLNSSISEPSLDCPDHNADDPTATWARRQALSAPRWSDAKWLRATAALGLAVSPIVMPSAGKSSE
jgi:hypothetical protein